MTYNNNFLFCDLMNLCFYFLSLDVSVPIVLSDFRYALLGVI